MELRQICNLILKHLDVVLLPPIVLELSHLVNAAEDFLLNFFVLHVLLLHLVLVVFRLGANLDSSYIGAIHLVKLKLHIIVQ